MPNNSYNYYTDRDVRDLLRDVKKFRQRKSMLRRILPLAAALVIIIVVVTVFAFAYSLIRPNLNKPNGDEPSTLNGAVVTEPPTETSLTATDNKKPQIDTVTDEYSVLDGSKYIVSDRDDPAYFDDAVIIGDSISYGLELYVSGERSSGRECLGNAKFLTSGSLSYANLLWDVSDQSVHPSYNGVKMKIEDSLPLIAPKKVYILLGSNDVGGYGVDNSVENAKTVIENIHSACPDAAVIVLSTTPKLKEAEERDNTLNNADIDAFNKKMREKCPEWGCVWLDLASQFKDDDGTLVREYCGDPDSMGIHLLPSSYEIWTEFLESHKIYPINAQ